MREEKSAGTSMVEGTTYNRLMEVQFLPGVPI